MNRIAVLLAVAGMASLAACMGSDAPSAPEARYASNLDDAGDALGAGDGVRAERAAFALTVLDEGRSEGYAAMGAAWSMQGKPKEARERFEMARDRAGLSGQRLVELLALSCGTPLGSPGPAGALAAPNERWRRLCSDAMDALLAGDAVKAERLAYAVTQLEEGRCEVDAMLGVALGLQSRGQEAAAAFARAKSTAQGPDAGLLDLLSVMASRPSGKAEPAEPPEPSKPIDFVEGGWYEVLVEAPDRDIVMDPEGRARMIATGLPWKVRDRKTGIVMLLCPPGEFWMGSPENELGRSDDEKQQRVSITQAFYISETEVTQEQWQRTMGANPSRFKGASNPVDTVSWNGCQEFCQRTGLRLPSESEWEYACRAGTTGAYAGDLNSMGWYQENSAASTHPVGQRRANPWGLYDMHGNVWEWCADCYSKRAAGTQAARSDGADRVLRGGSWGANTNLVRSSYRYGDSPGGTGGNVGFRVARAPL